MIKEKLLKKTLAALVAIGLSSSAGQALADSHKDMEKCYGVAKAGKNGCGSAKHGCAGQAKVDSDANEWVYLPKGTCDKIVGGSTVPGAKKEGGGTTNNTDS